MGRKPTKPQAQGFTFEGYDRKQYQKSDQYAAAIDRLYNAAVADFARLAQNAKVDPDQCFSFSDMPTLQRQAQQIVNNLASKMAMIIQHGTRESWLYANKKNDEFLAHIMNTSKIGKRQLKKMQDRNLTALDAFQARKTNGMDLSQRVWKYAGETKDLIELGIDISVGDGVPAGRMAKQLKDYLVEPNKLFRRVRDKHGNLVLSKRAAAYHPGRGVYRSSYQNSLRLARTEINMAYRDADRVRWSQLDFVVGYEVHLSNNHTCKGLRKGKVYKDICDELAGRYPKDFVFKGWHPNCRCYMTPILKDPKEFKTDQENALHDAFWGDDDDFDENDNYLKYSTTSKNMVNDVPEGFKSWAKANVQRSLGWSKQPYFIRDNFAGGTLEGDLKLKKPVVPAPIANTPTKHTQFDMLSNDEQMKLLTEMKSFILDREFSEACYLYKVDVSQYSALMKEIAKSVEDIQYWRFDEVRSAKKELEDRLSSEITNAKTKAEFALNEFTTQIGNAKAWIDTSTYSANLTSLQKTMDRANGKKYGYYPNVTNSPYLNVKIEDEIAAMKVSLQNAKDKANAKIAGAAAGEDVAELQRLVGLTPSENMPAFRIVAEIEVTLSGKSKNAAPSGPTMFDKVFDRCKQRSVTTLDVADLDKPRTIDEIVEAVGGGDNTKGSCASLSLVYAGNRAGMDVLDFRDGASRSTFSQTSTIQMIAVAVGAETMNVENDYTAAHTFMKKCVEGKEYILSVGQHAAVIRKVGQDFEYMELQSAYNNGWQSFTTGRYGGIDNTLKRRFGCKKTHTSYGMHYKLDNQFIDIELLKKDPGFRDLLSYINTAEADQRKGKTGSIK